MHAGPGARHVASHQLRERATCLGMCEQSTRAPHKIHTIKKKTPRQRFSAASSEMDRLVTTLATDPQRALASLYDAVRHMPTLLLTSCISIASRRRLRPVLAPNKLHNPFTRGRGTALPDRATMRAVNRSMHLYMICL